MISRNKFSNPLSFEVEKFDGNINFGLWQVHVTDVLIQSRLHKALNNKDSVKFGKEIVGFLEVISKLFFKERRVIDSGGNVSFEDSTLTVDNGKRNSKKNIIY